MDWRGRAVNWPRVWLIVMVVYVLGLSVSCTVVGHLYG